MFLRKLSLSYVREVLPAWGLANFPAGYVNPSEAKSQALQRGSRPGLMKCWSENFGLCMCVTQDSFWATMDRKPHASTGHQILEAQRHCVSKTGPPLPEREGFFFRRTTRTSTRCLSRSWSMFDCRMLRLRTESWVSARCVARTTRAACLGTSVPIAVPRCGWMELKRPFLLSVRLYSNHGAPK